ncbi:DNA-binding transcriptional regulator, MarR family [Clostridium acidisoli DSM 12555]|uniref:DNA-binding transcriptional regulator, MarR family n=1 Tax=Clostridium acidisoli DSM 12555 TaxID=1121291 RepID=A0A1W1XKX4_9CLOT|nr:MarR family transcriptional regulator [Clostridium acidisoli]SMC24565.1 DNA-binding transcriptional regulator, MarR family [Clostridium acidisoli DSM 12555]
MIKSYDESIGRLTNITNKNLLHFLNKNLEKFNITTEQWTVLFNLSNQNKISQKSLAKITNKDQPTLTRILDILERKNLIERHSSKEDRRSFLLHITENGLILKENILPFIENLFRDILKGISPEDLNIYICVLLQINKNIDNLK